MAQSKDIFKTLKNYSKGFHEHNDAAANNAYDAKVEELKTRIVADVEHAPEIIADEFKQNEIERYREAFSMGRLNNDESGARWKAIDNVMMALMDSKPLKQ